MHKPLRIENLTLSFSQKICFENFSAVVQPASRIGVVGRNGTGKSSLLKIIKGMLPPTEGAVIADRDTAIAYVPQTVQEYNDLSGGERFNRTLTAALAQKPDILLLDEPTNHLDRKNRLSLMRMLKYYCGTLIIVSHDRELLNNCTDTLWHIDDGQVNLFSGSFDDYMAKIKLSLAGMEWEIALLDKEKKAAHKALMQEQARAKKSNEHGKKAAAQGKWVPIVAGGKKRAAQVTAGSKKQDIRSKREDINERLANTRLPEIIRPKFSITSADVERGTIIVVTDGAAGYGDKAVLKDINFSLNGTERMAVAGDNASGKTTLIRALMGDDAVKRSGGWSVPKDSGYLDQHYSTLDPAKTVLESIKELLPDLTHSELRDFLNDFLFRKNEEVNALCATLSGGEKARLSLALIAAKTPKLLILDEVTNNIDYETKQHIIEVINQYPAAVIVISHEQDFLDAVNINKYFYTKK
jgi:ATPase subunit of ABC transporter with duplicated ATPase domains